MKNKNYTSSQSEMPEDEFEKWLDLVILFNDTTIFVNPEDDIQVKLLKQVKEKYLQIRNKKIPHKDAGTNCLPLKTL